MSGTIVEPTERDLIRQRSRPKRTRPSNETLSKGAIAELSAEQIHNMTHEELAHVVLAVSVYDLPNDESKRLKNMDREALERLVFLARRCCQNQGF